MATTGPYQQEARELVEAFLAENCLDQETTDRVVELFEAERYVESLETVLRNL